MGGKDYESSILFCAEAARKQNVVPDVHADDFIFRFVIENEAFNDVRDAVEYYFSDGARSAGKLSFLLSEVCGIRNSKVRLLEFASGYGCVTRHLNRSLPEVNLFSCDIHQEAVAFTEEVLGVPALLSHSVPEALAVPSDYDVVFALSFFPHLPKETWERWLRSLVSKLNDGGYLIFTTHGLKSGVHLGCPTTDADGFWFSPSSEQRDLDTRDYGLAMTLPKFVLSRVLQEENMRLVFFQEAFWWEHQDTYVIRKEHQA